MFKNKVYLYSCQPLPSSLLKEVYIYIFLKEVYFNPPKEEGEIS